ncbi:MAG: amino acid-binding protein [Bacteroidales bacterium]|nr:amino acid-binding protein [Bacteroidaceae bacterium]MBR4118516.1 amino acid-binding protein [Bacteroidales bacterium]
MTVHQLSVFAENKSGTIQRVLDLLKEGNIQIIASTIADTTDYGIYRIICSEPTRAYETLREAGISVNLTDVFAITLENEVGKAADTIKLFSDAGIDISYLYSFMLGNKGILIFRTKDSEKAHEIIMLNKLNFVAEKDLSTLI